MPAPETGDRSGTADSRARRQTRTRSPAGPTLETVVLAPAQKEAATTLDGPVLVIAGAGTGKTLTLVHRLVALVRSGVPAGSILLLTFTRRAAHEMTRRASALLKGGCSRVAGGTFHSFANTTLRRHGRAIGISPRFTVLDQGDTLEILGRIRRDLDLSKRGRGFPQRKTIATILAKARSTELEIGEILEREYPQLWHEEDELETIRERYSSYKRERHLLDFDDLLERLLELLQGCPEVRASLARRYSHIMVDEYQDTNVLQARITRALAGNDGNVMVVGDDAQSIYAFRGACPANLFEFQDLYPHARVVTLEESFRSTQPVLDLANALMGQMSRSFRKQLHTRREGADKPLLVEADDEQEQASYVATQVERLKEAGADLSDIGVLFRASSHAFALELELQTRAIPYVKYGGFKFFETAHIKDVLSYLRVIANPADDLSLVRVLMLCDGVGRVGAQKIQRSLEGSSIAKALRALKLGPRKRASIGELANLLADLEAADGPPAQSLGRVVDWYLPQMCRRFDDWPRRERDLEQLVALCERHSSVQAMLTELTLDPPTTSSRDNLSVAPARDVLVLSTMHSAKGLEWRTVFVVQALDGCIPMVNRFAEEEEDSEKLDEELRLLYVAVTRARDELHLVFPRDTARGWGWGYADPSRFLADIPDSLLVRQAAAERLRGEASSGMNR